MANSCQWTWSNLLSHHPVKIVLVPQQQQQHSFKFSVFFLSSEATCSPSQYTVFIILYSISETFSLFLKPCSEQLWLHCSPRFSDSISPSQPALAFLWAKKQKESHNSLHFISRSSAYSAFKGGLYWECSGYSSIQYDCLSVYLFTPTHSKSNLCNCSRHSSTIQSLQRDFKVVDSDAQEESSQCYIVMRFLSNVLVSWGQKKSINTAAVAGPDPALFSKIWCCTGNVWRTKPAFKEINKMVE